VCGDGAAAATTTATVTGWYFLSSLQAKPDKEQAAQIETILKSPILKNTLEPLEASLLWQFRHVLCSRACAANTSVCLSVHACVRVCVCARARVCACVCALRIVDCVPVRARACVRMCMLACVVAGGPSSLSLSPSVSVSRAQSPSVSLAGGDALVKFLYAVDKSDAHDTKQALELLSRWASIDVADALILLSDDFTHDPATSSPLDDAVRRFAVRTLRQSASDADLRLCVCVHRALLLRLRCVRWFCVALRYVLACLRAVGGWVGGWARASVWA
jgi:hypothetical protein